MMKGINYSTVFCPDICSYHLKILYNKNYFEAMLIAEHYLLQ